MHLGHLLCALRGIGFIFGDPFLNLLVLLPVLDRSWNAVIAGGEETFHEQLVELFGHQVIIAQLCFHLSHSLTHEHDLLSLSSQLLLLFLFSRLGL